MRTILTALPKFIGSYIRADLGSEKLELQLKSQELTSSGMEDLVRTGILSYLKLPDFMNMAKLFAKRWHKSEFLLHAMVLELRDVYLRYGFSDAESQQFRNLIGTIQADLKGLKGTDRDREISATLLQLRQAKIVGDMRS